LSLPLMAHHRAVMISEYSDSTAIKSCTAYGDRHSPRYAQQGWCIQCLTSPAVIKHHQQAIM
jgi:hypothetical protein